MYGNPFDALTPDQRVLTAVIPFAVAMILRLLLGRTHFTRWAVMAGTMWFAFNVLIAPIPRASARTSSISGRT